METRIPHGITSIGRPYLFNLERRPLLTALKLCSDQAFKHGWVIARISVLYKIAEHALMAMQGQLNPREWQTFIAGCLSGYVFMVRDNTDSKLKRQINLAVGVRTLYAVGSYLLRKDMVPGFSDDFESLHRVQSIGYTLLWGCVLWHWRHQSGNATKEMDVGQVKQLSFIHNQGDIPGIGKWLANYYLAWIVLLLLVRLLPHTEVKHTGRRYSTDC